MLFPFNLQDVNEKINSITRILKILFNSFELKIAPTRFAFFFIEGASYHQGKYITKKIYDLS